MKLVYSTTKKQLLRFIVVGTSAVATDYVIYFSLLSVLSHTPAKTISFFAGTLIAFVLNKYWTFNQPIHRHTTVFRFITLYSTTLVANIGLNALSLFVFPDMIILAFLVATGTSTILNFIGMKWWVFKL